MDAVVVKGPRVALTDKEAQVDPVLLNMSEVIPTVPERGERQVNITICNNSQ